MGQLAANSGSCAGFAYDVARESFSVIKSLAGIGLVVVVALASPARAATVLSTWDFTVNGFGNFSRSGQLEKFEPRRGTLQKVCLGMTGEADFEVEFNRAGAALANQLLTLSAKIRGSALGMVGDNAARSLVTVPSAPSRGSYSSTSTISTQAEFTPAQWREFLGGFGGGDTLDFSVDGDLAASVSGGTAYDHAAGGQLLANELRGRFYIKYVFDAAVEGDTNGDGWVNLSDFGIVKTAFGATGDAAEVGDLTGDGLVDLNDFGQLKVSMARAAAGGAVAVPEPAGLVLGAIGLLALAVSRRVQRRFC